MLFRRWSAFYNGTALSRKFANFPIDTQGDDSRSTTLYCHGLGVPWNNSFGVQIQQHIVSRGHRCTRFEYVQCTKTWSIKPWVDQIVHLIDILTVNQSQSINLMASSAGAQAALRAALLRSDKIENMLLVSSGVGLTLDYIDAVVPGGLERLERGEHIQHPGYPPVMMNFDSVVEYRDDCPVNQSTINQINLEHTNVGIVHSIDDRVVPFTNVVKLMRKLNCKHSTLTLLSSEHHMHMELNDDIKSAIDSTLLDGEMGRQSIKSINVAN